VFILASSPALAKDFNGLTLPKSRRRGLRSLIKLRDDRGFQPSGPAKGPLLLPWAYKPPKFGVILPTVFLKILKAPTRSALKISPVAGHLKSPLTNLAPLWGFPQTGHVCEVKN